VLGAGTLTAITQFDARDRYTETDDSNAFDKLQFYFNAPVELK
jgi:hypothetical protein